MPSSTVMKFTLKIGALPPDTFRVHEFDLNEALSECFLLRVTASSGDGEIAYADMIAKDTTLKVEGKDFTVNHHGMVTEFRMAPDSAGNFGKEGHSYIIIIEPHVRMLSYTTQSRIFQKKKINEIIQSVLTGASLAKTTHWDFQAKGPFLEREYTVQYNESDFDFISRLMEEEGIFYYFDHQGEKDVFIMADKVDAIKAIPNTPKVEITVEAGLSHMAVEHVTKLFRIQRMVTGNATVKDYNYRTPATNVIGKSSRPGQGEDYRFSPHVKTTAEAERMAGLRAEMNSVGKVVLEGEGICRSFRAGMRFELEDPSGFSPFKGKYTLVRVHHHGDQREGFEGEAENIIYHNEFSCMPADVVFRPQRSTHRPKISGIITARVDGPEGKHAYLDDDGLYHAKLPFDLSDLKDGQASLPIRMNQPYGGPNYGMHFPIHNGNDLVLAFVDGDVDRPVALGTLPNPSNASPVNKRNHTESIIRTASGHEIRLDDKDDKTVIEITTKGKHVITLNDDAEQQEIHIKTTDLNEMVFDDKNKNIRISTPDGAHTLKMDYDKKVFSVETKYGHKLTLDDQNKSLAMQTKDGHILMMDDAKKLIAMQDGQGSHSLQIDAAGKKVSIHTTGDMEFKATGKLDITAKEINLESTSDGINVKAAKDLAMQGANISAKGQQKVTLEATADASIKGLNLKLEGTINVDSKAGMQNKVTGVMTNVEASGINTVKGSMVMIN